MTTVRKSFTEEFKREAVRLAKERGNISAAARDLGISDNTLQAWKKQLEQTPENAFPGNANPRDPQTARLQREPVADADAGEIKQRLDHYLSAAIIADRS
jgi:transposase